MGVKGWIGWLLAMLGVLAIAPMVLGRGRPDRLQALEEISRMTDVERETLQRKFAQYQTLSEQQRSDLRELQLRLEADRGSGGRGLSTMYAYCDWLKTIDPWHQDELAHVSNSQEKAKRVAEIVQERQQRELNREAQQAGVRGPQLEELFTLTSEELTKIFDVLAQRLSNLTEEEQKQLDQAQGLRRFGLQVQHLRKSVSNPEALFQTISDAEMLEMVEASGNVKLKSLMNTGPGDGQIRKKLAVLAIFASCRNLMESESSNATDAELQAYFSTLSPSEQDQLLTLRADEFKSVLRLKRVESDPVISELRYLMGRQFSAMMRRMERHIPQNVAPGPEGPGGPPNRPGGAEGDRPFLDRRREAGGFPRPFRNGPDGQRGRADGGRSGDSKKRSSADGAPPPVEPDGGPPPK